MANKGQRAKAKTTKKMGSNKPQSKTETAMAPRPSKRPGKKKSKSQKTLEARGKTRTC